MTAATWLRELRAMLSREDPRAKLDRSGSNHVVIVTSVGVRVFASGTPGDRRALMNTRALVRRALRSR